MKNRSTITVISALALIFVWIGQAMAVPCSVAAEAHMMPGQDGHAKTAASHDHGCADCKTANGCEGTSLHCLKVDEKANSAKVQKTVKVGSDLALVAPVYISFKTKHHQIRGPSFFLPSPILAPDTLKSLHIRLQV